MDRNHLSGIRLMIQAAFAFSLMALCVKAASGSVPSIEIVFFRSVIGGILTLFFIRLKKVSLFGKRKKEMILRGFCGFFALSCFFYALSHLPLGTAVLLNYTSPFFVLMLSPSILKEKVPLWLFGMVLICFSGLALLMEAGIEPYSLPFAAGILSSIFAAVAYVTIRTIRGREAPLTIIFYFTLISTFGSVVFMIPVFRWPDTMAWLAILGAGLWAFAGQYWMTLAIHKAPASLVSPFSYLTPLLSYFYGLLFWGEKLTARSLTGVFIIITGGCLISYFGGMRPRSPAIAPHQEESA